MKSNLQEQLRKILFAFDLDDTLIRTQSNIIVRNGDQVQTLSPAEYAIYEPQPGDEFDFSQFKGLTKPEIIKDTFELFSKVLKSTNKLVNAETIILTARTPSITSDLQKFLDAQGLTGVELYAVGSSDPEKKAEVIQKFIDQGYNTIRFYDDSPKNVAAVKALKSTNPKVDIQAKLIKHEMTEVVVPADPSKVDSKELRMGIKVEMEHTDDLKKAAKIALQHLAEDPKYYTKLASLGLEGNEHEPMNPGILKKRLGKLSCSKVRAERAKLKDKGTTYAKALQRYLNYHCGS